MGAAWARHTMCESAFTGLPDPGDEVTKLLRNVGNDFSGDAAEIPIELIFRHIIT